MSVKDNKENVGSLSSVEKIIKQVKDWNDTAKNDTDIWRQNQEKWYRMRYRVKKSKTKPFVGCSNLRMPTLDTKIKKLKADLMQAVFGIRPVVQVIPTPSGNPESALKIEKFLDHLIMDVVNIKPKATIAIDQELQKGFYLMKPHWSIEILDRTETFSISDLSPEGQDLIYNPETPREAIAQIFAEKYSVDTGKLVVKENIKAVNKLVDEILAGKDKIKAVFKDVIKNQPDVALVDPEKLKVPAATGFDPQSALNLTHEFYITYPQLVQNIDSKGWKKSSLDKVDYASSVDPDTSDITKEQREGIRLLQKEGYIRVWECYTYWDINGDGKDEKVILTISPDFDCLFRAIELPFYSGKFPFVKLYYELTDDRWYSHRGLPELIEDLVKEIDIQHMQKIDSQTLRNTPMFLYRSGQVKGKAKNFGFGRGMPVSGMQKLDDIIKPFNATNTNAEFSYDKEQQMLEMKIGELIGQVDFSLQSQVNRRQPRTAEEVQMQVANQQINMSLDADQHRQQFQELFNWIWELWCQYGDDEYEFNYFGEGKYEPIKLNKEQLQGKYTIKVRANDNNFNTALRQQKATLVLQDTYTAFQLGLAAPESVLQARKQAMQELGIDNWEMFIQPPQPKQPAPQVQPIITNFDDLTDQEKAQVLASQGIQIDFIGRGIQKTKKEQQQDFENTLEIAKQLPDEKEELV